MRVLRLGATGLDVRAWQHYLTGFGHYKGEVDGTYGLKTQAATVSYQVRHALKDDGIVGPRTYATALMRGFPGVKDSHPGQDGPNWPPPGASPLPDRQRRELWGEFRYAVNPDQTIKVLDGWDRDNIQQVVIPSGAGKQRTVRFHRKAALQLEGLWHAWAKAGLLDRVLSWDGSYVPRMVRGSKTVLSNHAYGTAFDINAAFNPMGATPALKGEVGSVRELVELANQHGFFWGGHFRGRPDGMHFEVARLL